MNADAALEAAFDEDVQSEDVGEVGDLPGTVTPRGDPRPDLYDHTDVHFKVGNKKHLCVL